MQRKSFSLAELAEKTSSQLIGNPQLMITGVNTLEEALSSDASFLANPRYREAMKKSAAGVICVQAPEAEEKNYLVSENPSLTFQKIAELLLAPSEGSGFTGIHPTAIIHPTAVLGANLSIGPYAVIDRNAKIGDGTSIGSHVSIGFEVHIGKNCFIHPSCCIRERCILQDRVILQPGAIIGSCGFGYLPNVQGHFIKLEQLGNVILEDDVEIGANTTIDRSRFKSTIIRKGAKIDNLVQIAHNVEVGEHNVIAAQTGIAGSAKMGKHVMLGGQVGILGHVELDNHVKIATRGGASKYLKAGEYRGSPAIPIAEFHRQEVHVRKLKDYVTRIKELERKLAELCPK
jgi:UDP-3-O-[3-hydroxymyristoyl] glucosamine N-acyltransferase